MQYHWLLRLIHLLFWIADVVWQSVEWVADAPPFAWLHEDYDSAARLTDYAATLNKVRPAGAPAIDGAIAWRSSRPRVARAVAPRTHTCVHLPANTPLKSQRASAGCRKQRMSSDREGAGPGSPPPHPPPPPPPSPQPTTHTHSHAVYLLVVCGNGGACSSRSTCALRSRSPRCPSWTLPGWLPGRSP